MATRDLSNQRIQIWLGLKSAIANIDEGYVTESELAAMLMVAPAVRWDGLDFGMQASERIDDRSLDDGATATLRGFLQFGGGVPFFFPRANDTSSILRQVFDLVKVQGTELAMVERVGFVDRRVPGTAGDNVNIYSVMTDGYQPDTEGAGGYAYIQQMLPRGDAAPWSIVADDTPAAVTVTGGPVTGTAGTLKLLRAAYLGNDITGRATWTSSDQDVAKVDERGIVELVAAGTANIVASYPGGTASTPVTVTVS